MRYYPGSALSLSAVILMLCSLAPSLSKAAYADVLAFILQRNGMATGKRAFDGSPEMLEEIDLTALAAASGPAPEAAPEFIPGERQAPIGKGPSQSELTTNGDPSNWLYHTGSYSGERYSPLSEISTGNIGELQVACAYQVGRLETFYAGPIVYDGVIYITAFDAATGKERYRFNTGGGINGGISTYAVKGKQYIAVTSGGGTLTFGGGGSPTLFVFSLPVKK